ncbi:MAG TPA: peptidoglycan editing factor PgeF [Hyphomicrobium sp.]|nr:peptidoglycan editing factor PgeF [Hyphomicrobium sp.]
MAAEYMLQPITAANLTALDGIKHGFFTRPGGISTGLYAGLNCGLGSADDAAHVLENRRRVSDHLGGAHGAVVTLYQEHGATALAIDKPMPRDNLPKADAVVTNTLGLVIGVLTADCGPILFADPDAKIVAAAHAGWRGAVSGIIESTIAEMERIGAKRTRIAAALGPCINQQAYEVGPEFETGILERDAANARYFARRDAASKPHFDLPAYILDRLARSGITNIVNEARCTHANESLFFSFRRTTERKEADYGRQISAIVVA